MPLFKPKGVFIKLSNLLASQNAITIHLNDTNEFNSNFIESGSRDVILDIDPRIWMQARNKVESDISKYLTFIIHEFNDRNQSNYFINKKDVISKLINESLHCNRITIGIVDHRFIMLETPERLTFPTFIKP